jgi:hypothetical protein
MSVLFLLLFAPLHCSFDIEAELDLLDQERDPVTHDSPLDYTPLMFQDTSSTPLNNSHGDLTISTEHAGSSRLLKFSVEMSVGSALLDNHDCGATVVPPENTHPKRDCTTQPLKFFIAKARRGYMGAVLILHGEEFHGVLTRSRPQSEKDLHSMRSELLRCNVLFPGKIHRLKQLEHMENYVNRLKGVPRKMYRKFD